MKDGEVVGNPLGYKSERSAKKYIRDCDDHFEHWDKYITVTYGEYNGADNIPEELKKSGIFVQKFSDYLDRWGWFASSAAWEKNVWRPYVKEHYEIREREYEIVFKD